MLKMTSALGNLMANYTDSEGEELAEGWSESEGVPSVANISTRSKTQTNATGSPNCSATASSNKSSPV